MQISMKKEKSQKPLDPKQNDYLLFCCCLEHQYMPCDASLMKVLMTRHEVLNRAASKLLKFLKKKFGDNLETDV